MKHCILIFLTLFITISGFCEKEIKKNKTPNWLITQSYNLDYEANENEIIQGNYLLLADYQINIPKQENYHRLVTKITDNSGVQSASNLNVMFDPTYQTLIIHRIEVIRNGKAINKLNLDHFQLLRREVNAENFMYDGSYSAMLNLSDIRQGDVIDFSYTIKGFNPIHKGKYTGNFVFSDYSPISKINVCITSKNNLNIKSFNTNIEPKILNKGSLTIYHWEVQNPELMVYEELIPYSKIGVPCIAVSNYESIKDVVEWAVELFKVKEPLSLPLKEFIHNIKIKYKTKEKRIKAILNFVQNDIRYLGLEYGISGYKPYSPNKVFEQRFGDCKDKSLLLVEMLNQIEVEAYPLLVHSTFRKSVSEFPPSPAFFNHCVVKAIDKDYGDLYYDPTITNQGGLFNNIHFPNYEMGLIVDKNTTEYDTITSASHNYIVTLEEFDIPDYSGKAKLRVRTTYAEYEADRMRNLYKNNSNKAIEKEYLNHYSRFFPKIKPSQEFYIADNKEINEFIVTEFYEIDSLWKPMEHNPENISVDFYSSNLLNISSLTSVKDRQNDLELPYPSSNEHIIRINLPNGKWDIENSSEIINNDAFYFDHHIEFSRSSNKVEISNYIKFQKPILLTSEFKNYENDLRKLDQYLAFSMYTDYGGNPFSKYSSSNDSSNSDMPLKTILLAITIGLLVAIVSVLLINRNK